MSYQFATIDIETTGLNRYKDHITWIGVGLAKTVNDDLSKILIYDGSSEADMRKFRNVMKHVREAKAKTVFQNGKFDTLFIEHHLGLKIPIHEDTMLMGTAYDLVAEHGLKAMAKSYLGVPDWDIKKKDKLSGDKDTIVPYLKCDVKYTWQLYQYLCCNMTSRQMKLYRELLRPAYRAYRDIERNGLYIDLDALRSVRKKYNTQEKKLLAELNKHAKINWNSSAQVAKVFYEQEKMPIINRTAKGAPSIAADVLKELSMQGYETPKLLLEYKDAATRNKMFLNRWEDDCYESRIHPSFNLTNVVSGRTSCLTGDTPVMVPGGYKPIKDIKVGDLVYGFDENLRPRLCKVSFSGCTGVRDDVYRVWYKSQGTHELKYIDATSDHLVRLTSGDYRRVDQLHCKKRDRDHVLAIERGFKGSRENPRGYRIYPTGCDTELEHVFIFKELHGYIPEHVHHKDENPLNNEPENLIGLSASDHARLHIQEKGADWHKKGNAASLKTRQSKEYKESLYSSIMESRLSKKDLVKALKEGNGLVGAAKLLGRDIGFVGNRMKYYGVTYDGRSHRKKNNHTIWKVEKLPGKYRVYDISVPETECFIANGICVHNCNNPNLQQVPRTKDIRGLFAGAPGMILFEADYSQLELRIAAHYANEKTMLDIYRNNGDIHTETAKLFTNGRAPTKEERGKAKAVNFGFLYGMQAKKFVKYALDSYGQVFTQREAEHIRDLFFAKYARLLPWHKEQEDLCEMQGGVANMFGRFRKLPLIYSANKWERASAARRAINTPVQGSGSDLLISAVTQINKELKGVAWIGATVHDSIIGECRVEDKDFVDETIRRVMKHPQVLDDFGVELRVPLDVDIGWGPWGTH